MDAGFQSQRILRGSQNNLDKAVSNKLVVQKRRAAFGDITNNGVVPAVAGKKHCVVSSEPVISTEAVQIELVPSDEGKENAVVDKTETQVEMQVDWVDVDKDNANLPAFLSTYVNDIFDYYRKREALFVVSDYMSRHRELSTSMRAILIDWLVEVQQNFELVHETLYLAVKLTDFYLDRQQKPVTKDRLQLIGSTALNVACKFEERSPPVVDDFLYVCDDAYTRTELLEMEKTLLKTIGFDLGMPLSYTYLRRYAQCGRVTTPTLTLARYVLETSLMDYSFVNCLESKMAAACLLLAMNMNSEGHWDSTVIHYTGYEVSDLTQLTSQLNAMIATPAHKSLGTIKAKYSHPIFHEVAKIATLTRSELDLLCKSGTAGRTKA